MYKIALLMRTPALSPVASPAYGSVTRYDLVAWPLIIPTHETTMSPSIRYADHSKLDRNHHPKQS